MADLLSAAFMANHPEDAAAALAELNPGELAEVMDEFAVETVAGMLRFLPPARIAVSLQRLTAGRAASLVAHLPTTLARPVLQLMERRARRELLAALPLTAGTALQLVQAFPEGSVGAVMDTQVLTLPLGISAEEALKRVKTTPRARQHAVFVLDEAHRLKGKVAIHDLVAAKRRQKVDSLVQAGVIAFTAQTRLAVIENHGAWTQDTLIPVVDRKGVFLGVLDQENMVRALRALSDEQAQAGAGSALLDLFEVIWSAAGSLFIPPGREAGSDHAEADALPLVSPASGTGKPDEERARGD